MVGQHSRLAPRYPASLPCAIVHEVKAGRLIQRTREELTPAEIIELSIGGAALAIRPPHTGGDHAIGAVLTIRVDEMDSKVIVRHFHANSDGVRLGIEFLQVSRSFERMVNQIIAAG